MMKTANSSWIRSKGIFSYLLLFFLFHITTIRIIWMYELWMKCMLSLVTMYSLQLTIIDFIWIGRGHHDKVIAKNAWTASTQGCLQKQKVIIVLYIISKQLYKLSLRFIFHCKILFPQGYINREVFTLK